MCFFFLSLHITQSILYKIIVLSFFAHSKIKRQETANAAQLNSHTCTYIHTVTHACMHAWTCMRTCKCKC